MASNLLKDSMESPQPNVFTDHQNTTPYEAWWFHVSLGTLPLYHISIIRLLGQVQVILHTRTALNF